MHLSRSEILTPTTQRSCTGYVCFLQERGNKGENNEGEKGEKNHWYIMKKRWHNISNVPQGIVTPGKKEGKVESGGIKRIFQDFIMWEPNSALTLTFGHTFQLLSTSAARTLLHCDIQD